MPYASYGYYIGNYFGVSISMDDYPRFASLASDYIDYFTMGKAKKHADLRAIKTACCALAEQYQTIEIAKQLAAAALSNALSVQKEASESDSYSGELQSETVGSWSRTYRSGEDDAEVSLNILKAGVDNAEAELSKIAYRYLTGTGLCYRGARCLR